MCSRPVGPPPCGIGAKSGGCCGKASASLAFVLHCPNERWWLCIMSSNLEARIHMSSNLVARIHAQETALPRVRQDFQGPRYGPWQVPRRTPIMTLDRVIVRTMLLSMVIIGFGATRPEITSSIVRADGPGSLDPTFGIGGKVTTNVNPNEVTNVAPQPDGNIVVVAALADFKIASQVFGVLRYLSDGTLDPNFGTGGVVRTAVTTGYNHPYSVAIQPDGKIVVAGSAGIPSNSTDEIAVVRYNSNGTLDQSFGEGGKVTTVLFGFRDVANVVLLQPDGKILIGGLAVECFGSACPHDTAVVRYNPDGSLDGTFGSA